MTKEKLQTKMKELESSIQNLQGAYQMCALLLNEMEQEADGGQSNVGEPSQPAE